ncbi:MAG: hypothetical protein HC841_06140 [Verrucomicrobiae bacterium]|nr:hypothetical protein [Verrucomicrobiae bacterium]
MPVFAAAIVTDSPRRPCGESPLSSTRTATQRKPTPWPSRPTVERIRHRLLPHGTSAAWMMRVDKSTFKTADF